MRVAKIPVRGFVPVFWFAVLAIRCDDAATLLHRFEIKSEIVGHRKEPDVLGSILPVALCAAPFLSLPRNPVL